MRLHRVAGAAGGALALSLTLSLSAPALAEAGDGAPPCHQGETRPGFGMPMAGRQHASMMVASEAEYLAEMIPHHQEAVEAAAQLARSDRPEMRELGASIVSSQSAEIERMQAWLRDWYPDVAPADGTPMMRDLSTLQGDALDRAFLQDMIGHHMMAVMMSNQLLRRDLATHDVVTDFAAGVRDAQRAEIVTMRGWLREWFGGGSAWGHGRMHGMGMGMAQRTGRISVGPMSSRNGGYSSVINDTYAPTR